MVEYIVYICVTILVLYIYFTKTYPSNAGIFINKTLLSGKTKKTVKADKMPNPMHMNSTLNIWMKYNDVNYGTGWNKNYFEFRDCGQRKGAKKYWSREKDADGWFELGCPPQ